jgi:hypothetical protein
MITVPTVGSMLTVIGVALLAAAALSTIVAHFSRTDAPVGARPGTRRSGASRRRNRPLAYRFDAAVRMRVPSVLKRERDPAGSTSRR